MIKYIRKAVGLFLTVLLITGSLTACGSRTEKADQPDGKNSGLHIVTTIFPEYDWAKRILGDNPAKASLTLMADQGVDLHSYQPTTEDILKISSCDLFIYVGGPSDQWVEDVLTDAVNPDMVVINLMELLGSQVKEEEEVEGMQAEEENAGHETQDQPEYDEHVWLSLRSASVICDRIEEALVSLDPEHESIYKDNLAAYQESLKALDQDYEDTVSRSRFKTLLFGDRFPFRYLVNDYGLNYYAAFAGCSAETDASFETITFLAGKLDELGLPAVIIIDGGDGKVAGTIVNNSKTGNHKILRMDSIQSTGTTDLDKVSYLSVMEQNLKILEEALN